MSQTLQYFVILSKHGTATKSNSFGGAVMSVVSQEKSPPESLTLKRSIHDLYIIQWENVNNSQYLK